jgi:predicted nucleotidyltransferase
MSVEKFNSIIAEQPFPLVFATLSGAHLYGFPSPDSDFDVRGVHLLPLGAVVGLNDVPETIEVEKIENGLELDLVTHDAKKFFNLLLKKNGYVLEQLFSPLVLKTSEVHDELKSIAKTCITRHHSHHYFGFAATEWKLFEKDSPPRAKPLLYIFRVLLTGIYLMQTGEIEANLVKLNEIFKLPYVPELIERKINGREKSLLLDVEPVFYQGEYQRLRESLQTAFEKSNLPETPSGKDALNDLLVRLRLNQTI